VADLAAKNAWIERVLGVKLSQVPALKALVPRLKAAEDRAKKLPEAHRFISELYNVIDAVLQGNSEAANELDHLESALSSGERAASAAAEIAQAGAGINAGVVAFAKIRLRWNAVQASRSIAGRRLGAVLNEILDAEFADDPGLAQARAQVAHIGERIPQPSPDLQDALDDLAGTADPAERAKARTRALQAITGYRRALGRESLLADFQNTEYGSYRIKDEVLGALDGLEAVLRP
jgi:hypothetical protein